MQHHTALLSGLGTVVAIYDILIKLVLNSNLKKILFVHNIHFSCPIILKICTEHGSIIAVLCKKICKMIGQENIELQANEISKDLN